MDARSLLCFSVLPTMLGSDLESGTALDAAVAQVIDRASIPGRSREPKLATQLTQCERVDVSTLHGTVAAWRVGDRPAALLVHGWRDSSRLWDPLMASLSERGRSFVALDLPGHGFSEGDRCLVAECADAVAAVATALGPICSMVAHSFACGGAALAVAEGLSVDRLVLIAPALAYRDHDAAASDAIDAGRQRWRRIAGDLGFAPAVGDVALERFKESLGPRRAEWDLTDGLAGLDCEVLLVASEDDGHFDPTTAQATAARLSHCEFLGLAGLDHRGSARDGSAVEPIADFLFSGAHANAP